MMNPKRNSVTRLLTPIALALTIAACSSQPPAPTYVDFTQAPSASSETYIMRADANQGGFANEWLILAFKAALEERDYQKAESLSNRLSKQNLTTIQQAEWQLVRSQLNLATNNPEAAFLELNFPNSWPLSPSQWQQYHRSRADALTQLQRYFEASRELVAMTQYAPLSQQKSANDEIWANLERYSPQQLNSFDVKADEDVLDGWVQLAAYMKALTGSLPQLQTSLKNWLAENPNHPAALYTPQTITDILQLEISTPHSTALLLPLTGKYAKQAQFVRDGFMMAMMNDNQRDPQAVFTIVDTNETAPSAIKQRLATNNVDFIVGPLIKENVEKLQNAQATAVTPIPALALNIPSELEASNMMCYLTLSPEQEVAQAAQHLNQQEYQYPLIIVPKGSLGDRAVSAFKQEWATLSDHKVAVAQYTNRTQLQKTVNQVFGLQESQQRIAQMEALVGMKLENQPRSRRDIDSVYIVANNADLTLIKPFIEVAINPDTKQPQLFADSHSHTSKRQYEDLTGVIYSDIPLLIEDPANLNAQMTELWPKSSNVETRLRALGMDAYALTKELPQLKAVQGYQVQGQTGDLSIGDNCVIQRQVAWAEYGKEPVTPAVIVEPEANEVTAPAESTVETGSNETTLDNTESNQ
ncbi:penicillin-binding protein activator [Vibrio hippocampi]|uniref:Penicillin-binding protein activator LpoA n=1 Tax=Vibrio hippocampi TaxID=654686 RepID=A0ABM8ZKA4_9VIBR|nr:penicillin-binding protein activator [Vibrio hippocampi]CAH0527088.1 Penicillin-binding protein activator LpoA [Vibrio hippocampi]